LESGARLIVVNLTPTPADARADVVLRADVAEALPRIVDAVREAQMAVS
jgi:NAD-dependent SIR2 family protein deacetylase